MCDTCGREYINVGEIPGWITISIKGYQQHLFCCVICAVNWLNKL